MGSCVVRYQTAQSNVTAVQGMFAEVLSSILASSSIFLTYAMLLVVRTHPWWDAQYFIPMLGMLLGNCISGISVGLTTLLEELTSGAPPHVASELGQQLLRGAGLRPPSLYGVCQGAFDVLW